MLFMRMSLIKKLVVNSFVLLLVLLIISFDITKNIFNTQNMKKFSNVFPKVVLGYKKTFISILSGLLYEEI